VAYDCNSAAEFTPPRRVVVTGVGVVSPMGVDVGENAAGFRAGRSAFREVDFFEVSRQRVRTAGVAEVPEFFEGIPARRWQRMDRGTRLAALAAREALADAGLAGGSGMAAIVGTSAAAMPIGEAYFNAAVAGGVDPRRQLQRVETYQVQRQLGDMLGALGVSGRLRIVSNACASGANAVGQAFQWVRMGRAERVLAGGYDALCQLVFAGFDSLQALSASGIPRPFDAARDGLALGEGAAFLVVESAEAAAARGAKVWAEIEGYAAATDTHHLTQPHPDGDAALATMTAACAMAGVMPAEIDYLNSHGTGTPLNDVAEARAIERWAGDAVAGVRVSSTKSAIGHLLGGAGAVEAAICLMALDGQWLPPSLHVREVDPVVKFDLVREPREATVRRALTNSFGFGGANATLVFGKEGGR
jgi:3-oxoacyl-[acyl-carrier-protein] synthase II